MSVEAATTQCFPVGGSLLSVGRARLKDRVLSGSAPAGRVMKVDHNQSSNDLRHIII